ncbi:hypothetical protein LOK49_LG03G00667 [Camellia lanceoleosa]|uniref:Uncharacterized protein n=1 Tax=Camellia lanceoleosa TaxID=1840588 RepID=A0ACC0IFS5_9ERIC|nr:hypothetical protein LOK49_LG03G00667 [Camellia lanceoleosa]
MRRSSKKPSDFLNELPPLPSFNFQLFYAKLRLCEHSGHSSNKESNGAMVKRVPPAKQESIVILKSRLELQRIFFSKRIYFQN